MKDVDKVLCAIQNGQNHPWQRLASELGLSFKDFLQCATSLHHAGALAVTGTLAPSVLVIGCTVVDLITRVDAVCALQEAVSARFAKCSGGVGRNVADNLARLNVPVKFVSIIGEDSHGLTMLSELQSLAVDVRFILTAVDMPTAAYITVLDRKGSIDFWALHAGELWNWFFQQLSEWMIDSLCPWWAESPYWLLDLNLSQSLLTQLIEKAANRNVSVYVVAASERDMCHLPEKLVGVDTLILNADELAAYAGKTIVAPHDTERAAHGLRMQGVKNVVVTHGAKGVLLVEGDEKPRWFMPRQDLYVTDVTGAGDAFSSGLLTARMRGHSMPVSVLVGMRVAECVITHFGAICPEFNENFINQITQNIHKTHVLPN